MHFPVASFFCIKMWCHLCKTSSKCWRCVKVPNFGSNKSGKTICTALKRDVRWTWNLFFSKPRISKKSNYPSSKKSIRTSGRRARLLLDSAQATKSSTFGVIGPPGLYGYFQNLGYPKMDGENVMENPMNKWMIWGVNSHYFWRATHMLIN